MIPRELHDKIRAMILLLGSDRDGEAMGAGRAIRRTLEGAGLDLHTLADAVTGGRVDRNGYPVREGQQPSSEAGWNYANHFRQGRKIDEAARHPDALAIEFGLPLYSPNVIESWREVGRHCLRLNRDVPKKHGGKFLRPFEIEILTRMAEGLWPRNGQVDWIKTVIARCHQARDKMREASS